MKTVSTYDLSAKTSVSRDAQLSSGTILLVKYLPSNNLEPAVIQATHSNEYILGSLDNPGSHWGAGLAYNELTLNKIQDKIGFAECELAPVGFTVTLEVTE